MTRVNNISTELLISTNNQDYLAMCLKYIQRIMKSVDYGQTTPLGAVLIWDTIFTLSIGTTYLLTMLVLPLNVLKILLHI